MAYSQRTKDLITHAPRTAGNTLGRWAVHLEFPVTKIAYALGVTRQTVYNWFAGGEVFVAYQQRVELLNSIMSTSRTADEAWSRICKVYDLKT
jgi:DNA invertase Pin-like site-specific DNA recombinase